MKRTKRMSFANIVGALIFIAIGVYAIVKSLGFKHFKNSTVDPSAFPQIMATGLIVCSIVLLVMNIMSKEEKKAPSLSLRNRGIVHALLCALVAVLYVVLWEPVGFLVLAPVSLFVLMYLIDMRNYKVMIIVSITLTLIVWLLFYKVLSISVPLGFLEVIYDVF